MSAIHVNDQNFDAEVLQAKGTVLVDFFASWCGPCRQMSPIVDEVADELGESVRVVKANVDESPASASQFGVQSIPAFVVLQDGAVKQQFSGAVSKEALLEAVGSQALSS